MRDADLSNLPLFRFSPPKCSIIPFPCSKRVGRAKKIAERLAKVKTDKGASNILDQAFSSLESQLERAGIPQAECDRQCDDFVRTIYAECMRIGSQFYPTLPEREDGDESPNGAA